MSDQLIWFLVFHHVEARFLVQVAPRICKLWRNSSKQVLAGAAALIDPSSLYRHLHGLSSRREELLARLVLKQRVSASAEHEQLALLCVELANTGDARVLKFNILMCANTFEGNPRRSHKRRIVHRVVSPWFSLMSWHEKSVLGSSLPELLVYFTLRCASGRLVAEESHSSFFDVTKWSLDCDGLWRDCNLESADQLRALLRACMVPLLKPIVK
jgi:hypothetical protein